MTLPRSTLPTGATWLLQYMPQYTPAERAELLTRAHRLLEADETRKAAAGEVGIHVTTLRRWEAWRAEGDNRVSTRTEPRKRGDSKSSGDKASSGDKKSKGDTGSSGDRK